MEFISPNIETDFLPHSGANLNVLNNDGFKKKHHNRANTL